MRGQQKVLWIYIFPGKERSGVTHQSPEINGKFSKYSLILINILKTEKFEKMQTFSVILAHNVQQEFNENCLEIYNF